MKDENALTVTVELLLTFSISAVLLSIIALSFQGILISTTDIAIYRELSSIGSDLVSKIQDFDGVINTASIAGEIIELTSQVEIPSKAGGSFYTIAIQRGLVKLVPEVNRNIEVKIPISPLIAVANCSISSAEKTKILRFNRTTGVITIGECDASIDTTPPVIAFTAPSPANGSTISQTVKLRVNAVDNIYVVKVEYYLNDTLVYTAEYPYQWEWNTERYPNGEYRVKAIAYDRTGNTASDLRVYKVIGLPPGNVSDLNAVVLTYPDVLLRWTKPAIGSVASYKIYRSTEPINDSNLGTATLLANSWFDSPASYLDSSVKTQGMTYYYAVTVVNNSGVEGALSNVVNVTIPIIGTWNSSDLEPASFTPSGGSLEKIYSFTPVFPSGMHGFEVDIAINISSHTQNGGSDNLHLEVSGLISDKSIELNGAKTYWFNETASPSNNTAYNLRVYISKKNKLDEITWDCVQVFIKYSS
ncbi:MAG: Ig-like domain-containing protein [Methanocellales archaeon]